MAKWEYAAIVCYQFQPAEFSGTPLTRDHWRLVKPINEPSRIFEPGKQRLHFSKPSWSWCATHEKQWERHKATGIQREWEIVGGDGPEILFEHEDLLTLVNTAGAEGWEITGGLGLGGHPETRWRMMRREL